MGKKELAKEILNQVNRGEPIQETGDCPMLRDTLMDLVWDRPGSESGKWGILRRVEDAFEAAKLRKANNGGTR